MAAVGNDAGIFLQQRFEATCPWNEIQSVISDIEIIDISKTFHFVQKNFDKHFLNHSEHFHYET